MHMSLSFCVLKLVMWVGTATGNVADCAVELCHFRVIAALTGGAQDIQCADTCSSRAVWAVESCCLAILSLYTGNTRSGERWCRSDRSITVLACCHQSAGIAFRIPFPKQRSARRNGCCVRCFSSPCATNTLFADRPCISCDHRPVARLCGRSRDRSLCSRILLRNCTWIRTPRMKS